MPAGTRVATLMGDSGAATRAMRAVAQLRARLNAPDGSAGRLLDHRAMLTSRAMHALSAVDTIRALLASQTNTIGRFRRDSSLILAIGQARDSLAEIGRLAANPGGTLGRLRADSALFASVDSTRAQMAALFTDMKAHPFRYLYVF